MEYKPVKRRIGIMPRWGYYVSPIDNTVLIPDPKKLDALHYAFRMRAKYNTSTRDCAMWLHGACGQRITPSGFLILYKFWLKRIKTEKKKELEVEYKKQQAEVEQQYKQFGIALNDTADISSLAYAKSREAAKKKEQTTR